MNLQALALRLRSIALLAAFSAVLPVREAQAADPEAEFYRGKTVSFIIRSQL